MRSDFLQDSEEVFGSGEGGFAMDGENVCTGAEKGVEIALGMGQHEMDIEGFGGIGP